jgi:glycyl-tRNA synthetase beta subunit
MLDPRLLRADPERLVNALAKRGVTHGAARRLYSARRLAVLVEDVASEQPEQRSEVLGPYLNIGLDADGMVDSGHEVRECGHESSSGNAVGTWFGRASRPADGEF